MTPQHRHLDRLAQRLRVRGALAEAALGDAVAALINQDASLATTSMAAFVPIGGFMVDIEDECLTILASHAPVPDDLRFVLAMLRLADDVAGIAEVGHSVARQVRDAVAAGPVEAPTEIRSLGTLTIEMLHDVVQAVTARDCRLARSVLHRHAAVRGHRREVCRWTIRHVRTGSAGLAGSLHVGWIARDIEHIAAIAASAAVDLVTTLDGWPLHTRAPHAADRPLPATAIH